jgi:hypothetical protein
VVSSVRICSRGSGHPSPALINARHTSDDVNHSKEPVVASDRQVTEMPGRHDLGRVTDAGSGDDGRAGGHHRIDPNVVDVFPVRDCVGNVCLGDDADRLDGAGGGGVQVVVDQGDGGHAFAYCGGDPFDRSLAHVTGGEHPGQAGFQRQRQRRAAGGPAGAGVGGQVRAGEDEPPLVTIPVTTSKAPPGALSPVVWSLTTRPVHHDRKLPRPTATGQGPRSWQEPTPACKIPLT